MSGDTSAITHSHHTSAGLLRAASVSRRSCWRRRAMAVATTMAVSATMATAFVSPVLHGPPSMFTTAAAPHGMNTQIHAGTNTLTNAVPTSASASTSGHLTEVARNRVSPRMGLTPEPDPVYISRATNTNRQRQKRTTGSSLVESARQRRAVAEMYALPTTPGRNEVVMSDDASITTLSETSKGTPKRATKKRVQVKRRRRMASPKSTSSSSKPSARGTTSAAMRAPRRRTAMKKPAARSAQLLVETSAASSKPKGSNKHPSSTEFQRIEQRFAQMEAVDQTRKATNEEWAAAGGKFNMEALRQVLEGPTATASKQQPVQFRGLSTTQYRGRRKKGATVTSTRSRSSTMPGFSAESDRQLAYKDGIRFAERQSGIKLKDTAESREKRRKVNGVNMYMNSASVPDSMIRFADEIHQEGRITRQEEIELGEKTQEAIRLQRLYDGLEEQLSREPTDEEWCAAAGKINMEAIRQTMEEGLEAKNKLVTSNLRMVQSVVNTYIRNGLSAQYNAGDLMQEGIVALIRAAEKFEPQRGWKFSTYAMYWVRASVKRSQIYQSRVITIPQRLYETHKRVTRIQHDLQTSLERKPTLEEIGEKAGMSPEQVQRCLKAMDLKCFSIDQSIQNVLKPMSGETRKDGLVELIQTNENDDNEMRFLREAIIETLNRHLSPGEVELLLLRYGLKEAPGVKKIGRAPTIAELSLLVGLKPDKVRRTINNALKHLQTIESDEWKGFARELC